MYSRENTTVPATADEVFQKILKRIVHLELEPGQLISENQMSKEYGVSRSVIRTAFTRLRQLGFIEIYPQRGTYVSLIDLHHISDLLVLRIAVEKEVVYEIFTKLKEEDRQLLVQRLDENMAEQEQFRNDQDYSGGFARIDTEFHGIMMNAVELVGMMHMLDDIMLHMARWRNFDVAFGHRVPHLVDEHRNIVEAMRSGNLYETQRCIENHLETISAIVEQATAAYPNYFKTT